MQYQGKGTVGCRAKDRNLGRCHGRTKLRYQGRAKGSQYAVHRADQGEHPQSRRAPGKARVIKTRQERQATSEKHKQEEEGCLESCSVSHDPDISVVAKSSAKALGMQVLRNSIAS